MGSRGSTFLRGVACELVVVYCERVAILTTQPRKQHNSQRTPGEGNPSEFHWNVPLERNIPDRESRAYPSNPEVV